MDYPSHLRIRGLPFLWQGWNTLLEDTGEYYENKPIYVLQAYRLYGFFEVPEIFLIHKKGWVLCESNGTCIGKKKNFPKYPQGRYTGSLGEFTVSTQLNYFSFV